MASVFPERRQRLKRLFLGVVCFWFAFLALWMMHALAQLQAENAKPEPFGVFTFRNGAITTQDFSYNLLYLEGIAQDRIAHPYRMAEQEAYMRDLLPGCDSGMTHAYSPVALALAAPLLHFSGQARYDIYAGLCAVGLGLLFAFVLLPRADSVAQLAALGLGATSVCLILSFALGQSAIFTTPLLGALWILLGRREARNALWTDLLLALLFWALCIKPNVTLLPAMLLLGARAWRSLALGLALLLATWTAVAGHYGGWWTGLSDYSHLLNHYNGAEMTAFMQRSAPASPSLFLGLTEPEMFSLERALVLAGSAALLCLRWSGRLTPSEHFQAMVATLLLVSPYLLPSEDLVLLLLVVEGPFFRTGPPAAQAVKVLLVFGILDLRAGLTFPWDINYPLRAALFAWMLIENRRARAKSRGAPSPGTHRFFGTHLTFFIGPEPWYSKILLIG